MDASDVEDLLLVGDGDDEEGGEAGEDLGLAVEEPTEHQASDKAKRKKRAREEPPPLFTKELLPGLPQQHRSLLAEEFEPQRPSLSLLLKTDGKAGGATGTMTRNAKSFGDSLGSACEVEKPAGHRGRHRRRTGSSTNVAALGGVGGALDAVRMRGFVALGMGAHAASEVEASSDDSASGVAADSQAQSSSAADAKPVLLHGGGIGQGLFSPPSGADLGIGSRDTMPSSDGGNGQAAGCAGERLGRGSAHDTDGRRLSDQLSLSSASEWEVDEGTLWMVTQMLGNSTVGDLIRGLVRICNLKGGPYDLTKEWAPRTPRAIGSSAGVSTSVNSGAGGAQTASGAAFRVQRSSAASSGADSDGGAGNQFLVGGGGGLSSGYSSSDMEHHSQYPLGKVRKARLTPLRDGSLGNASAAPDAARPQRTSASSVEAARPQKRVSGSAECQSPDRWSSRSIGAGVAFSSSTASPPGPDSPSLKDKPQQANPSNHLDVLDLGGGLVVLPSDVDPSRIQMDAISGVALPPEKNIFFNRAVAGQGATANGASDDAISAAPPSLAAGTGRDSMVVIGKPPHHPVEVASVTHQAPASATEPPSLLQLPVPPQPQPQALPLHFDLRIAEANGEVDDDYPPLERTLRVVDVGETTFGLLFNGPSLPSSGYNRHVLEVRVQPAKSSKGADVLFISFRRPKAQWRALYAGHHTRESAEALSPNGHGSGRHSQQRKAHHHHHNHRGRGGRGGSGVLGKLLDSSSSVDGASSNNDEDSEAGGRGRGAFPGFASSRQPSNASGNASARAGTLRELDEETDSDDDNAAAGAGRGLQPRALRGGDRDDDGGGEDISFDEWYRREYGDGDAEADNGRQAGAPDAAPTATAASGADTTKPAQDRSNPAVTTLPGDTASAAEATTAAPAAPAPSFLQAVANTFKLWGSRTLDAAAQRRQEKQQQKKQQQDSQASAGSTATEGTDSPSSGQPNTAVGALSTSSSRKRSGSKAGELSQLATAPSGAASGSTLKKGHGSGLRLSSSKADGDDDSYAADVEASAAIPGPNALAGRRSRGNSGSGQAFPNAGGGAPLPPPLPLALFAVGATPASTALAPAPASAAAPAAPPASSAGWLRTPRVFFGGGRFGSTSTSKAQEALAKQQEQQDKDKKEQGKASGKAEAASIPAPTASAVPAATPSTAADTEAQQAPISVAAVVPPTTSGSDADSLPSEQSSASSAPVPIPVAAPLPAGAVAPVTAPPSAASSFFSSLVQELTKRSVSAAPATSAAAPVAAMAPGSGEKEKERSGEAGASAAPVEAATFALGAGSASGETTPPDVTTVAPTAPVDMPTRATSTGSGEAVASQQEEDKGGKRGSTGSNNAASSSSSSSSSTSTSAAATYIGQLWSAAFSGGDSSGKGGGSTSRSRSHSASKTGSARKGTAGTGRTSGQSTGSEQSSDKPASETPQRAGSSNSSSVHASPALAGLPAATSSSPSPAGLVLTPAVAPVPQSSGGEAASSSAGQASATASSAAPTIRSLLAKMSLLPSASTSAQAPAAAAAVVSTAAGAPSPAIAAPAPAAASIGPEATSEGSAQVEDATSDANPASQATRVEQGGLKPDAADA